MSFPKRFDKLPKDAQRAVLAVTHIENVTLATVLKQLRSRTSAMADAANGASTAT